MTPATPIFTDSEAKGLSSALGGDFVVHYTGRNPLLAGAYNPTSAVLRCRACSDDVGTVPIPAGGATQVVALGLKDLADHHQLAVHPPKVADSSLILHYIERALRHSFPDKADEILAAREKELAELKDGNSILLAFANDLLEECEKCREGGRMVAVSYIEKRLFALAKARGES